MQITGITLFNQLSMQHISCDHTIFVQACTFGNLFWLLSAEINRDVRDAGLITVLSGLFSVTSV